MTTLYLHIGTEKTGTTSIQRFLDLNREILGQNGILYPLVVGKRNQFRLAIAAQNDRKRGDKRLRRKLELESGNDAQLLRDRLGKSLAEELAGGNYSEAIMSSEHCSSRLHRPSEVARLKELLSPLFSNIWIIVYLRRQDDFLLSTYSTSIKSGSTEPLKVPVPKRADARYNHLALLSRWADVFGRDRIICRKFEKASLKSDDVIEDFLNAAGINPNLPFRKPAPANESLDATSLEFLRLFNKYIPSSSGEARGKLFQALAARPSDGTLVTLEPEELASFMAQFEESNRQVADAYFGGALEDSDDPLFAPRSDLRVRARPAMLTADQAVEIAAWLWRRRNPPAKGQAAGSRKGRSATKRQRQANATAQPAS